MYPPIMDLFSGKFPALVLDAFPHIGYMTQQTEYEPANSVPISVSGAHSGEFLEVVHGQATR